MALIESRQNKTIFTTSLQLKEKQAVEIGLGSLPFAMRKLKGIMLSLQGPTVLSRKAINLKKVILDNFLGPASVTHICYMANKQKRYPYPPIEKKSAGRLYISIKTLSHCLLKSLNYFAAYYIFHVFHCETF